MKIGTLFSGIGAPEQSIKSLGIDYQVVFACDNDPYVKQTYLLNYDCDIFYDDITSIKKLPKVDLLVFGFPCQPFSMAGYGGGIDDPRGKLLLTALSLIEKTPPTHVIAENVEGLVRRDGGKLLNYIVKRFEAMGYHTTFKLLNALDFGIPQRRNRLWIVATKKKDFKFPQPFGKTVSLKRFLRKEKLNDYTLATTQFLLKDKVKNKMSSYTHNYIPCITHTISRNGSSSEYISYVAAVNKAIGQARKPSVEECLKLFGFSTSFVFPENISITRRYNMIGNSMVVPVVKSLIYNLFL